MSLTILTPLGALLTVCVLVPLVALARARLKAARVREGLGVTEPHRRTLAAPVLALVAGATLLGLILWRRDR